MINPSYVTRIDIKPTQVGLTRGERMKRLIQHAREIQERERMRLRAEIMRIPGLMNLLMRPRNGERWSVEDRAQLKAQLRGLGIVGLYLATLAIPGTTITLPLLAWWLDRRRYHREPLTADMLDKELTPPNR